MTKDQIKEGFKELPAINYNLYIGSGDSACDNCLGNEEAEKQIFDFFSAQYEKLIEECIPPSVDENEATFENDDDNKLGEGYSIGFNAAIASIREQLKERIK